MLSFARLSMSTIGSWLLVVSHFKPLMAMCGYNMNVQLYKLLIFLKYSIPTAPDSKTFFLNICSLIEVYIFKQCLQKNLLSMELTKNYMKMKKE